MSERITEAIAALRSASEISSAQDALKALSGLVEGLTLEDAQVGELQGELAEVDANVEELQLALNLAKADLDKFKESHRFFSRAFGSERREWRKLRKAIKERAAALARGQALEISLTLLLDQAAGAEGRPTGLRAAEWRTRIETATGEGAEALGAVLVALRDESKNDEKLIGGLQEALATHTRAMKRAKLRKLVRMMRKGLGGVADDIQLQEALFNDALTTLRTLVEAEATAGEVRFAEETMAAEWLADVTPRLDELADAVEAAQSASDAVEVALPTVEQAERQVEQGEERLAELEDKLAAVGRPNTSGRPSGGGGAPSLGVPGRVLLPRGVARASAAFASGRFGAPRAAAAMGSFNHAAAAARIRAASVGTASASTTTTTTTTTTTASASGAAAVTTPRIANAAGLTAIRPSLEHMAGIRPIPTLPRVPTPRVPVTPGMPRPRVPTTPGTPVTPRPPTGEGAPPPRPRPNPVEEEKKRIKAEIATVKEQLVARRAAASRAKSDVDRKRRNLSRALGELHRALDDLHAYLATWPMFSTMPEPILIGLPEIDLGNGIGLAGPEGGLLPATLHVADIGDADHMQALEELLTSLLAEVRSIGEVVSTELGELNNSTSHVIDTRMAELLGGEVEPL